MNDRITKDSKHMKTQYLRFALVVLFSMAFLLVPSFTGSAEMQDRVIASASIQVTPSPTPSVPSEGGVINPVHIVLEGGVERYRSAGHPDDEDKPERTGPPILDAPPPGHVTVMTEDYEGIFPSGLWSVFDKDGSTNGEYYWDDDDFKPHAGSWSAWPANGGADWLDPLTSDYPNDMDSWMVYGPFDLSDSDDASLRFYYWNDSEENYDYLRWLASKDGVNFHGLEHSGETVGWQSETFDLTAVPVLGDLTGEAYVWIAFQFQSDYSLGKKGAFVDDILLSKKPTVFDCSYVTEIPVVECDALEYLYANSDGSNWTHRAGWVNDNTPCSWYGVTCNLGHVVNLVLNSNNLDGSVSTGLVNLSKLERLELANNSLDGTIPANLGTLPDLSKLNLNSNALTGSVPGSIGNLSVLSTLMIAGNPQLSGPLPQSMRNLKSLDTFYFYNTSICEPVNGGFQTWLAGISTLSGTGNSCPPAAPTPIAPKLATADSTPVYKWTEVSDATRYWLYVYSFEKGSYVISERMASSGMCSAGLCTFTHATPLSMGDYRFRVRSYSLEGGWGGFSDWMNYTYGPPKTTTLYSPNGTIDTSTPTYKWKAVKGTFVYRLSVYSIDTSNYVLSENVKANTNCSGGICSYKPTTALSLGDYRFKVKGHNVAGWGPVSNWMKFKYGTPAAPTLISPHGTIVTGTPTYKWKAVSGAYFYKLSVYFIDGSSTVISENVIAGTYCSGGTCSYKPTTVLSQGNYRFFVRGHNAVGWGPQSTWKTYRNRDQHADL
jgi:hypothetical protein